MCIEADCRVIGWFKLGLGPISEVMGHTSVANGFTTALPIILAHSEIITVGATVMCIIGGLLIYGTIISFGMFFQEEQEF
jgi:hypothetical protein